MGSAEEELVADKSDRVELPGSKGRLQQIRREAEVNAAQSQHHGLDSEETLKSLLSDLPKPKAEIEVILVVRRRCKAEELPRLERFNGVGPNSDDHYTRTAYASRYRSDPDDIARLVDFVHRHELRIIDDYGQSVTDTANPKFVSDCAARRMLRVAGTPDKFDKAFAVSTKHVYHEGDIHRVHEEPVSMPANLEGVVTWVYGLETEAGPGSRHHMAALTASRHELGKAQIKPLIIASPSSSCGCAPSLMSSGAFFRMNTSPW